MSRSYRKYHSSTNHEYENPDWGSIRQEVRSCLNKALRGNPDGDVVFPLRYRTIYDAKRRCYHSASEIRIDYFTEIRNILNGYHKTGYGYGYESDAEEYFLHWYNVIRGTEPDDHTGKCFDWLNTAEAVSMVKAWKGEPLAILPVLTRGKIIEKAVVTELKRRNRKW